MNVENIFLQISVRTEASYSSQHGLRCDSSTFGLGKLSFAIHTHLADIIFNISNPSQPIQTILRLQSFQNADHEVTARRPPRSLIAIGKCIEAEIKWKHCFLKTLFENLVRSRGIKCTEFDECEVSHSFPRVRKDFHVLTKVSHRRFDKPVKGRWSAGFVGTENGPVENATGLTGLRRDVQRVGFE